MSLGIFLEGNIQGMVTDYKDNPIEGVGKGNYG